MGIFVSDYFSVSQDALTLVPPTEGEEYSVTVNFSVTTNYSELATVKWNTFTLNLESMAYAS